MTGFGFCGPMTAMGTVFADKSSGGTGAGMRYRYGFRQGWIHALVACFGG